MSTRCHLAAVLRRSVALDRGLTHRAARAELRGDPILIFSMGKTGTTSLTETLALATGRPVMKAHALTAEGIAERLAKSRRLGIVDRPRFLWTTEAIRAAVLRPDGRRWSLICGVRDPIALAVSDHFYGVQLQADAGVHPERQTTDLAFHRHEIAAVLEARFLDTDWFADELRPLTGIDVYSQPSPAHAGADATAGARVHDEGRFRALVIRFEDLTLAGPALRGFLDLDETPVVPRRNSGTADLANSPYHRFLHEGDLPVELVERVYATRLARHFYTDAERAEFAARWTHVRAGAPS